MSEQSPSVVLLAFCRDQAWWPIVESLFDQDVVIDVHVAGLPEEAIRPERRTGRGGFGILVPRGRAGVLIVRACADCATANAWHVDLVARNGLSVDVLLTQVLNQHRIVTRSEPTSADAASADGCAQDWH